MIDKEQIREHYTKRNQTDCGSKLVFPSYREAQTLNHRSLRHRGSKRREKLHPYKCLNCGKWHLGHEFRHEKFH
jgi:ribosomal protein L32